MGPYALADEIPSLSDIHHNSVSDDRVGLQPYWAIFKYKNSLGVSNLSCAGVSLLAHPLLLDLLVKAGGTLSRSANRVEKCRKRDLRHSSRNVDKGEC